jgi:hypothetical protein
MGNRWNNLKPLDVEYIKQQYGKKTTHQIAKDLNATTDRVRRVMKMHGIEVLGKSEMYKNIKKFKFVYEDDLCNDYKNGYNQKQLCVKYKIGMEKLILLLERNGIDRTKGKGGWTVMLWKNGKRKLRNCNKGGTKDIYNSLYARWKANAKSRNFPFNVDIEYLQKLLENQNFKCAYTNMDMLCPKTYNEKRNMTSSPYLISLDRIDNELGYIEGNVQFVCVWTNKAKGAYHHKTFIDILNNFKKVNV